MTIDKDSIGSSLNVMAKQNKKLGKDDVFKTQEKYFAFYRRDQNDAKYRKAWKLIQRMFSKPGKMLDIGCANGAFCQPLLTRGWDCYGLELFREPALVAKKIGVKVTIGDTRNTFPYRSNTFDLVFAGEIIEHQIDDLFFLKECRRVLKKNGVLILTTPNLLSLGNRILMTLGKEPRFALADFHYKVYTPKIIIDKINKSGFKVTRIASSYILISKVFNSVIGTLGEFLGWVCPKLGEHFVIQLEK